MTPPRASSLALVITQEDPAQSDVVELCRHGEAYSASLYPPESNHHLALEGLRKPEVCFLVARDAHGKAVATGAIVLHGNWAEIKRIWVEDHARGRGVAGAVLDALTAAARGAGIGVLRLETGVVSHAARALYERAGFRYRAAFADYRTDPLSVFMERLL
jgi:putative acetyltransferase